MRSTLVLTTSLLLVFVACHKPRMCCGPAIQPGLIGGWRLIQVDGGLSGGHPVPADSPVTLTLGADSSYTVVTRSALTGSGTFHLADTPIYGLPQPAIVFNNGIPGMGAGPQAYTINHDTLLLGSDIADGPEFIYVKTY